ncbi:lipoate--protein ligase [bacterium]|nr:lipoate--protein ligase [bacterium]
MYLVNNLNSNPYFNIAAEEYLLRHKKEDYFMLYINLPSIIIGKNQNALSEINIEYVKKNKLPVVRRLSGGGAVYHSMGNLNFSFIIKDSKDNLMNFKKFTTPIIEVLKGLSINAESTGRNDLVIDGKKFSGNAQFKSKDRFLHHGTLLFSSDISEVSKSLNADPIKFEDKSTKSVSSRVTNIADYLNEKITIGEFKELILKQIITDNPEYNFYEFSEDDLGEINELVKNKYKTWDWNYGYSPKYNFSNKKKFSGGLVEIYLDVEDGIIKNAKIYGDFFSKSDIVNIEKALKDIRHSENEISGLLAQFNIDEYFINITKDEILSLFF